MKIILNPNKRVVEAIKNRLEVTKGYCPCVAEQTSDTICPCTKMREELKCCCSLYVEDIEGTGSEVCICAECQKQPILAQIASCSTCKICNNCAIHD